MSRYDFTYSKILLNPFMRSTSFFFVSVPKTQFVNDFSSSRIDVSKYVIYTERKRGSFISMTLYF